MLVSSLTRGPWAGEKWDGEGEGDGEGKDGFKLTKEEFWSVNGTRLIITL